MEKRKPGVMVYFDMRQTLEHLSDRHVAALFRAILEYGETGRRPKLPDKLLVLWPLVEMRINTDDSRYRENVRKRKYAAYCRWAAKKDIEPLCYEEWLAQQSNPEED